MRHWNMCVQKLFVLALLITHRLLSSFFCKLHYEPVEMFYNNTQVSIFRNLENKIYI